MVSRRLKLATRAERDLWQRHQEMNNDLSYANWHAAVRERNRILHEEQGQPDPGGPSVLFFVMVVVLGLALGVLALLAIWHDASALSRMGVLR